MRTCIGGTVMSGLPIMDTDVTPSKGIPIEPISSAGAVSAYCLVTTPALLKSTLSLISSKASLRGWCN
jgi:hypothetical protein